MNDLTVTITISEKVLAKFPGIFLAYTTVSGVKVEKSSSRLIQLIKEFEEEARRSIKIEDLKNNPIVRAYRDFYWRIGIDPTKQRPASEALLRRILRGKSLPLINNVVDAGNLVSAKTLVPVGLYDLDKVKPPIILRFAENGEKFTPIGGDKEELKENQIVLADTEKILHIFPHRDSRETCIRESTRNVLIVACGVPGVPKQRVLRTAREVAELIVKEAGGLIGEIKNT